MQPVTLSTRYKLEGILSKMVGMTGLEPATRCSQSNCATTCATSLSCYPSRTRTSIKWTKTTCPAIRRRGNKTFTNMSKNSLFVPRSIFPNNYSPNIQNIFELHNALNEKTSTFLELRFLLLSYTSKASRPQLMHTNHIPILTWICEDICKLTCHTHKYYEFIFPNKL
jgi:hypothetical protein